MMEKKLNSLVAAESTGIGAYTYVLSTVCLCANKGRSEATKKNEEEERSKNEFDLHELLSVNTASQINIHTQTHASTYDNSYGK